MDLAGEGGPTSGVAVRLIEADPVEKDVGREVESRQVVGDVHMAVVVDPFGQDDPAIAVERGFGPFGHVQRIPRCFFDRASASHRSSGELESVGADPSSIRRRRTLDAGVGYQAETLQLSKD
jgi:hypothetical protein